MNLEKIEKKYLKAYNKWLKWESELFLNKKLKYLYEESNYRNLYDFFDEQEIYILPLRGAYHEKKMGFGYEIQYKVRERQHGIESRPKAEEQAFLRAFEILEKN